MKLKNDIEQLIKEKGHLFFATFSDEIKNADGILYKYTNPDYKDISCGFCQKKCIILCLNCDKPACADHSHPVLISSKSAGLCKECWDELIKDLGMQKIAEKLRNRGE